MDYDALDECVDEVSLVELVLDVERPESPQGPEDRVIAKGRALSRIVPNDAPEAKPARQLFGIAPKSVADLADSSACQIAMSNAADNANNVFIFPRIPFYRLLGKVTLDS